MDHSSETDPQTALDNAKEALEQKVNEWQTIIERLMKGRFDATHEFVNKATEKLQHLLPSEMLEMPAEDFIDKFINAPPPTNEVEPSNVYDTNLGNQTMAALDQIDYLMNSSHHDAEIKETAAKLQQFILAKK